MKLIRLKLGDKFRSLQAGFELHFLREWDHSDVNDLAEFEFAPYVLSGRNGSGKSNVLEALGAIFYHLECQYLNYRPDSFAYDEEDNPAGFQEAKAKPNDFELEYLIPVSKQLREEDSDKNRTPYAHIKIIKTSDTQAYLYWLNRTENSEKPLSRIEAREMLPDFVLGYSSGENEILSLPFFKMRFIQLDEYLDSLKSNISYGGKPESRQTYLDSGFNQAILLSNLIFQDEKVLVPFQQEVEVMGLQQFRIILKKSVSLNILEGSVYPDELTDIEGDSSFSLPILKNMKDIIDRLQRCATCQYEDDETDSLYLDYYMSDITKAAFKNNFSSAIDFFQSLQILLTLNLYTVSEKLKKELYGSDSIYMNETVPVLPSDERVMRFKDLVIIKKDVDEKIYAKSLSDGEHQFLHSLGLALLYKDKNCLFLLDEPETHFNPDWRSKFISRLRDCFALVDNDSNENEGEKKHREMLITTHTPFLISDSKPENVLVFKKDENNEVTVTRPDYNTLGASINKITLKTFGKKETIGGYAEQIMDEFKARFDSEIETASNDDKQALINEINLQLGDSVEKLLLLNTILDSMETPVGDNA